MATKSPKKNFAFSFKRDDVHTLKKKNVHRIDSKHSRLVTNLIERGEKEKIHGLFGQHFDIADILYRAHASLGVVDDDGELVGVACIGPAPTVPSVPAWSWYEWLRNLFGCEAISRWNAIWITFLAWTGDYADAFLRPMLEVFFSAHKNKQHVLIAIPPGFKSVSFLGDDASRILPKGYFNPTATTTIGLMSRQRYVTRYKIRRAVEEDNDDIVPLIDAYATSFVHHYGRHYVAEILTRCPDGRQIIVAEHGGYAVAVVVINDTVNYDVLNEHFELACFNGLRKPHWKDSLRAEPQREDVAELLRPELTLVPTVKPPRRGHRPAPWQQREQDDDEQLQSEQWDLHTSVERLIAAIEEPGVARDLSIRADTASLRSGSAALTDESDLMLNVVFGEYESRLYSVAAKPSADAEGRGCVVSSRALDAWPLRTPTYHGAADAFAIEVAVARAGHDDALDLLVEASFEGFEARDYAIACVPSTHAPMPLLARFVRVAPRPRGAFPDELFVLHRSAVMPEIEVRMGSPRDIPYVEEFLENVRHPGNVREQFLFAVSDDPAIENSSNMAFIVAAYGQVVGLAILSENVSLDYVAAHYQLSKWMDVSKERRGTVAVLENFLVYPIFQNYSALVMNQLHRLSDYATIFCTILPEDATPCRARPLCNILQHLMPIMPRDVQEYSPQHLQGDCMPAQHVTEAQAPFSLLLSMSRLSATKRVEISSRIVVIGAGTTATSFLETLLCSQTSEFLATFTSVTVVSPHGLGYDKTPSRARDCFQVYDGYFSHRRMQMTALRTRLNFVMDVMVGIDRKRRRVALGGGAALPYDALVLLVGEQHQGPTRVASRRVAVARSKEIPENVFIVNDETDVADALKKVAEILNNDVNPDGKVIVYGRDLKAHCALAGLIEYGVPRELLVYVDAAARARDVVDLIRRDDVMYGDPDVAVAIATQLRRAGVAVHRGVFHDWDLNVTTNVVATASFECASRMLRLPCRCMFMYAEKSIGATTFKAICDSGLVFDGRLVIDANFRTNDAHIYAAGSATKYSRKYHADHMSHIYYNAREVGAHLARRMRAALLRADERASARRPAFPLRAPRPALPRFRAPLVRACALPGALRYLHVTRPGRRAPIEHEVARSDYGQLYVTGDLARLDRQGYFRVHVNALKTVETITCVSARDFCVADLIRLWGKHVSLLNNLHARFELMLVPDLFEFFREPWTCAIYHDRFADLMTEINAVLLDTKMESGETIVETVLRFHLENEWRQLNDAQKEEILRIFDDSEARNSIERKVVDYVAANTGELPMYAHPNLIRSILHDYERSPMFQE